MAQMISNSGLLAPGYLTKVPNQHGSSHILCDLSNTSACSRPCATEPPLSQADVKLICSLGGYSSREQESSRLIGLPSLTGHAPWSSWRKSLRTGHAPTYADWRWKPPPMGGGSLLRPSLTTPNPLAGCRPCDGSYPASWGGVPVTPLSEIGSVTPERGKPRPTCTYKPLYMCAQSGDPPTPRAQHNEINPAPGKGEEGSLPLLSSKVEAKVPPSAGAAPPGSLQTALADLWASLHAVQDMYLGFRWRQGNHTCCILTIHSHIRELENDLPDLPHHAHYFQDRLIDLKQMLRGAEQGDLTSSLQAISQ